MTAVVIDMTDEATDRNIHFPVRVKFSIHFTDSHLPCGVVLDDPKGMNVRVAAVVGEGMMKKLRVEFVFAVNVNPRSNFVRAEFSLFGECVLGADVNEFKVGIRGDENFPEFFDLIFFRQGTKSENSFF